TRPWLTDDTTDGDRFPPTTGSTETPLQRHHDLAHQRRGLTRGLSDAHAGRLERLLLGLRRAGRAGDDRPGVPHRLALGCGEPGDVADHGLGDVRLHELRCALLGVAAD